MSTPWTTQRVSQTRRAKETRWSIIDLTAAAAVVLCPWTENLSETTKLLVDCMKKAKKLGEKAHKGWKEEAETEKEIGQPTPHAGSSEAKSGRALV